MTECTEANATATESTAPAIKPDGGPAFPVEFLISSGMTLRDYFAGQVLAGCVAHQGQYAVWYRNQLSAECYAHADAMLAARDARREDK